LLHDPLLRELGSAPVLGVSLAHVSLLRLDQTGGPAPGNKSFKLHHFLSEATHLAVPRVVSLGGVWSNHLHALAALGHHHGIATVGVVRGEQDSAMLADARRVVCRRADFGDPHGRSAGSPRVSMVDLRYALQYKSATPRLCRGGTQSLTVPGIHW